MFLTDNFLGQWKEGRKRTRRELYTRGIRSSEVKSGTHLPWVQGVVFVYNPLMKNMTEVLVLGLFWENMSLMGRSPYGIIVVIVSMEVWKNLPRKRSYTIRLISPLWEMSVGLKREPRRKK